MPKLLVLDKSVFQNTSLTKLCQFAKSHNILAGDVLFIECLISPDQVDQKLLIQFQKLIKAGAMYTHLPFEIVNREKEALSPIKSIVDKNGTDTIRTSTLNDNVFCLKRGSEKYQAQVGPIIKDMLKLSEYFYAAITKKKLLRGIRTETGDNVNRLTKWAKAMKPVVDNEVLKKWEPEIYSYITHDWYTWHDYWLRCILSFEWAYQKAKSGQLPTLGKASHDFHDMQYVACLSRADGILTNDKDLVIPLARAAFPKKDVFSSLDDVTDKYFGSWH
ncbi:MAG TPA: hypothetical protein HPP87_03030 [Planctomycetes bacterium]|nr:hypothetical protein [Planctomycetota bacterium]